MMNEIEILLVEDNPDDEELTLLTLNEHNIANSIKVVHDGDPESPVSIRD